MQESPDQSGQAGTQPLDRPLTRHLAGERAAAYRAQAEQMRRLALGADLDHRKEIFLTAARRFDALAQLEESVANGPPRSWSPR